MTLSEVDSRLFEIYKDTEHILHLDKDLITKMSIYNVVRVCKEKDSLIKAAGELLKLCILYSNKVLNKPIELIIAQPPVLPADITDTQVAIRATKMVIFLCDRVSEEVVVEHTLNNAWWYLNYLFISDGLEFTDCLNSIDELQPSLF